MKDVISDFPEGEYSMMGERRRKARRWKLIVMVVVTFSISAGAIIHLLTR